MSDDEVLTARYSEALSYVWDKYKGKPRKSQDEDNWPPVPEISHVLSVSSLVLEHGGTEDQAIAALLHDVAEDHGGEKALEEIRELFGDHVAMIVEQCSDDLAEDPDNKRPWLERKQEYIAALAHKHPDSLLVSCADKVHNTRSILNDHRRLGDLVYKRFKPGRRSALAGRRATLWYYDELLEVFKKRFKAEGNECGAYLAAELERLVSELHSR